MANEDQLIQQLVQAELMKALELKSDAIVSEPKVYGERDIEDLKQLNALFSTKYVFEKNQIVRWKKGLQNRRLPAKNQPAIVMDVLHPPILSSEEQSGSPYFREPLDIVLGFIDESDGDFMAFHYDSRRFEPYLNEI